ncbi:tol-pal system protein YbgF [Primorskyibacter flagellatus]|uniref:Cell division coordinator CpoB n=1 Tax=Primorskyibacter flagellatus TaxID=1387277 RepID=A0A1W2C788_9RHOB|nr:tol-pal system protein YbgF [Primorskyibacter flagellatus]SMC80976.1 tol-pal system protein YbgF [Primorskyibacter flagellatus]
MFRATLLILSLALPGTLLAQDRAQSLADIRQDLTLLSIEVKRLRTELSTTGAAQVNVAGDTLERVNSIEAELQRLTSKTEELEFRIDKVIEDGTNRIGDLEFRLVELEGGDVSKLGETSTLGGGAAPAVSSGAVQPAKPEASSASGGESQLAVGEETDFRRASEALANGDFQSAADQFETFRQTYPGGPLEPDALLGRGRALEGAGDMREAARAYLDSYSGYPQSKVADVALFKLGEALGKLGKTIEACLTLAEVEQRFPSSAQVVEAQQAMAGLSCQ